MVKNAKYTYGKSVTTENKRWMTIHSSWKKAERDQRYEQEERKHKSNRVWGN
jgi:hypothetical protein